MSIRLLLDLENTLQHNDYNKQNHNTTMKQSGKKMTRGQMVYAPINTTERTSKSPFGENKKIVTNAKVQQEQNSIKQSIKQSTRTKINVSPPKTVEPYEQGATMNNSASPYHDYEFRLEQLTKQNQLLRSREQIYVGKLFKLQQGLSRQHQEFMNLQELYNQLFNVYKQKQEEFAQLQLKYKETQKIQFEYNSFRNHNNSFNNQNNSFNNQNNSFTKQNNSFGNHNNSFNNQINNDKLYDIKNSLIEENFKHQLAQLIYQNKRLNETNQKLITQLNYLKSKHHLQSSKQTLQTKIISQINDTQKLLSQEKQQKLQLQYQNKFFKLRIQDLQKTITDLQKIISLKQNQIIKMRQQKIHLRKQSSQKIINRSSQKYKQNKSPPKSNLDSARSKNSNTQLKFNKIIDNLQKQNNRLRQENFLLKQKIKSNLLNKQNIRFNDSLLSNSNPMIKKLDFHQSQDKYHQSSLRSYQNENFNSQNINEQYFSFSRQRDSKVSEQQLPTFPMDLEIEGIIRKHQEFHKPLENHEAQAEQIQNQI